MFWILGLVGGWVALTLAMNLPRERRLRRLAASRAGTDNFAVFRAALPDMPEDLLRCVYAAIQDLVPGKDFPLRADDNLWTTLEVDEGSLDGVMENLMAKSAKGVFVDSEASPPIATVADLAKVVWWQRQQGGG